MQFYFRKFESNQASVFFRLCVLTLAFGVVLAQAPALNAQAAGEPKLILTKSIEGGATTAQVGDVIRYRIRFECSSLVDPCGELTITDVLQSGLTYLPPPNSSVPSGFTITEAPAGTVTIRKTDNMLLDGSQYDAVIAVKVNYDLRPLPATINNTINGTIDPPGPTVVQNALPASAPPITISGLNPSWGLTKTLFSPSINPTVDTDVTYQIRLCPTSVSGNVSLQNVVITDTLPTNAVFRSASDGGTNSSGTVTWNITGPITPPSCATRFVTILYPAASFPIGTSITNTANATGDYLGGDGSVIHPGISATPVVIVHPIDPIKAVPSYSKNDVGDPVGFTGTARFVLGLNTNGTNYPSNSVMLIDNMPPQLQVTEITGGLWSSTFDYVRAYLEYSTNNANTWTTLAGPYSYFTGGTYTAPAANITNVRWRFEYDSDGALPFDVATTKPGLPYTWSFTSNPEIRVKPRAVAINTDPPAVVSLPIAVSGTTYNNCAQVSRIDNVGPQLDPCATENMTVRGDFVSLRTSKGETPGTPWDDAFDPNINTFTSDFSILPGDTLKYTITVDMTERSSAPLVDPTILDTLPTDLVFVRNGTATLDGSAVAQPKFIQSGQDLKWTWDTLLGGPGLTVPQQALGSHLLRVEFFARIPRGQLSGVRTNNLYVATNSVDVLCEISGTQSTDTGSIDGDGNTTEAACKTTDDYIVERSAALRGEKWIRSVAVQNSAVSLYSSPIPPAYTLPIEKFTTDAPAGVCPDGGIVGLAGGGSNQFTRYPCVARAFPENSFINNQFVPPPSDPTLDDFEYNLRIFNDGNVPMMKYVLYDILPYYGDKGSGGTLTDTARDSQFRPALRDAVTFISGPSLGVGDFTIDYNLTTNPCRPEVFNQNSGAIPSGCDNNWIPTTATTGWLQADWATVRSYRIRLNNGSLISPSATSSEVRFGVPMYIPADTPPLGAFNSDDPQSYEIAWNSFSHVGSYTDLTSTVKDLLASEPRKVGITIPEMMSVGNRVWRDSDNSGTINPPDDTDPGIGGVVVNLYRDANYDGVPDGAAIATTTTDTAYTDGSSVYHAGGYYLFSNIPYDPIDATQNRYIIGIPASNFAAAGPLYTLHSSTGTPSDVKYTNPPSNDLASKNPDSSDHGIDSSAVPPLPSTEVYSAKFTLEPTTEPTAEADLSNNDRDGIVGARRGVNGERDYNSDLTVDFGFFGGTDIPFSIGNHLWKDDGSGSGGIINDGIRQAGEPPVVGARVELYRDGNKDGNLSPFELIRFDVTDSNGFYLFDNLDPGDYYVLVAAGNFTNSFDPDGAGTLYSSAPGVLQGWYSSQPTFSDNNDLNDNGLNNDTPETLGIVSNKIVLDRAVSTPLGESHLSGELDPGIATRGNFSPTGWDGPYTSTPAPDGSRGRYGETDATSNLTVDFGFIPPMSLGNSVWIDDGSSGTVLSQFNDGVMNGTEVGVDGVTVQLWRDTNATPGWDAGDTLLESTLTANGGYYLFERLQPGNNYYIRIPASNFAAGKPLVNYISSFDATAPADNATDKNDNGIDNATPATNGITSQVIAMAYNTEPLTPANETDISAATATYGVGNVGLFVGQTDSNSNLTMDFGFVQPPHSIGNRLWFDVNNNRQIDAGELPVEGARISLYRDSDNNGIPDDVNGDSLFNASDALAFDITDAAVAGVGGGYYLFDNLPAGRYLVGVDRDNFDDTGVADTFKALVEYASSTGTDTTADNRDNGIDRIAPADATVSPHGILSANIDLTGTSPTGESSLSSDTGSAFGNNPTVDDGPNSRGRFGEADNTSNLQIDFGFYKFMSIGNRVFRDDGGTTGILNDGIMNGDEQPFAGVRVELYRDTNGTAGLQIATDTLVNFDITDAGGYYLFDHLAPGNNYYVHIPASNFIITGTGVLRGWSNSTPTGVEDTGIVGNAHTPTTDGDDNGVNNTHPEVNGISSGVLNLAWDTEPQGELELSGQANPGAATNNNTNPTGWDGPNSRGRWNESDDNSNLTVDFGFIPPLSLGNRVWIDNGATIAGTLPSQYNNGIMDGTEAGRAGVVLNLYFDANNNGVYTDTVDGVSEATAFRTTTTDANGYYLFDGLPLGRFYVQVAPSNFSSGNALYRYQSSTSSTDNETVDINDNGQDSPTYLANGIHSMDFVLGYNGEPTGENVSSDVAYGPSGWGRFGEADTSSNLTLDFGFMSPHSIGNRVWRDSDNSGTINAADDTNPGIAGVTLNLYFDANNDGVINGTIVNGTAETTAIRTTTSDSAGFYLFDNLPTGNYIVGIPASNFATITDPLYTLRSSTGTPASATYQNPPETNADSNDHGIDSAAVPPTPSTEVFSPIIPLAENEVTGESDLPANTVPNQTAYGTNLRGRYGEPDYSSDLTVDFGFFGGTDVPFSIGNHLWKDDGSGGGIINDGIRQAGELPVVGARVELYRDGNKDGNLSPFELIRFDVTDNNGFYLFDNLDPGDYYVLVAAGNFTNAFDPDGAGTLYASAPGVLRGWYSSQPTFSDNNDLNDNGLNNDTPETLGVVSNKIVLDRAVSAPLGESHLSGQVDPGAATRGNFSPTGWDGDDPSTPLIIDSRGRFGETDATSNLTVDFGFIPPMSLGNRVWIDSGSTALGILPSQFNDGVMNGTEVGVDSVTVQLWRDTNATPGWDAGDTLLSSTATANGGYYLFERLQPGNNYYIRIPASNFTGVLVNYISSTGQPTIPPEDNTDKNDNGVDNAAPATNGITSQVIDMAYNTEPLTPTNETDISAATAVYGVGNVGLFAGQTDANSNLTKDFGFILPPHSIGNRLWFDNGSGGGTANDQILNGTEPPVVGARVNLYRDSDNNGIPDDINNTPLILTDDWLSWDTTDANGYYLFDNLPAGHYIVGVDYTNFQTGNVLDEYTSSTGTTVGTDQRDNGVDRVEPGNATLSPYGVITASIDLTAASPTGETLANSSTDTGSAFGNNPTVDDGPLARGRYGETDANSDLMIDFGFYKPMSIGNRVFRDDGGTTGALNDGIMNGDEQPFAGVRVELYRDTNNNGVLNIGTDTLVNFDITDAGGYYLFDRLLPGNYFVHIPASNFTGAGVLHGWYNSGPTFATNVDSNDNGINNTHPELNGISSEMITLAWDTEPPGETDVSGNTITTLGNSPTAGDGLSSRGRWNESDDNSNLTIDFGFIPPLSLGNRVWIDDGSTATGLVLSQFNNGIMDGTEAGSANVALNLYFDANNNGVYTDTVDGVSEATAFRTTTTDANGYYLFDGLPLGRFYVQVAPSNFTAVGNPLYGYHSSTGSVDNKTTDINDNGQDSSTYLVDGIRSMDFVLGYGGEPKLEIDLPANTPANQTAYGTLLRGRFGEADASSNLTLDFGFMSPRSLGNRIWLDDGAGGGIANNGIMDGGEVGINGVNLSLYADNNGDHIPDGPALLTTTSIAGAAGDGYYLFSNFPTGQYIVGVDSSNFSTGALQGLSSSFDLAGHPVDADADKYDNGIDQTAPAAFTNGILSPTIDLRNPPSEPVNETDLSGLVAIDGPNSRGTRGEADNESDLTVDFGFFYPFSIGNRVFRDDGGTTGTINDGIMNGDEAPIANVRVELYRDTDGTPGLQVATDTLVRYDTTDAGGYYLFDGLNPGDYYIHIPSNNFTGAGALLGFYSSTPTGTETTGVNGNTTTTDIDRDDNGVNNARPDLNGISSGVITLARTTEPTLETEVSGNTITTVGNSPTAGDGTNSRGRWNESDNDSNLTIDFGFVPPLSLGNRVWLDNGSTATGFVVSQFDNGIMDGTESGISGVVLNLYYDANHDNLFTGTEVTTPYATTTTDASGYYLFDKLPEGRFYVAVTPANFTGVLAGLSSSTGSFATQNVDVNDNGMDDASYTTNGIRSNDFVLSYGNQPLTAPGVPTIETDIPAVTVSNQTAYGANLRGRYGETDANSNLTLDFGFVAPPRSLGNRIWLDDGAGGGIANNGIMDGGEVGINGVAVSLYADNDGNGVPDGAAILTTTTGTASAATTDDGYYLFSNLPPRQYIVGVDGSNFATVLLNMASSMDAAGHPVDGDADKYDHGIDRTVPSTTGIFSPTINLITLPEPTGETDLSGIAADGPIGESRGTHSETDDRSDLTVDFGFYYPFSIGNRIWSDNGGTTGILNNGIMDGDEQPIAGVRVELYRDTNGTPGLQVATDTLVRFDTTDAPVAGVGGGYYLFDGLTPGEYYVHVPATNFTGAGVLTGYNNSTPTSSSTIIDRDDNGVNNTRPDLNGISSGPVVLSKDSEPTGEETSGNTMTTAGNNPTAGDGPNSWGRYGESDKNSNLTIDFGFVPVYSLGNRVWLDTGAAAGHSNNGIMDGDEAGISGVTVHLYLDANNDGTPDGANIGTVTTDSNGYYRFDNLIAGTYIVEVVPPTGLGSTVDANQDPDDNIDNNDDGVIVLATGEVRSKPITIGDAAEPTGEEPTPNPDSANGEAPDTQSNRTVDFGFVNAVAIGNVVWFDTGAGANYNNGILDAGEQRVAGAIVELYNATTNTKVITGPDGIPNSGDESLGDVVTNSNGYYKFDQLVPGDYYVRIPASEFQVGKPLYTYLSSNGSGTSQSNDNTVDENGIDDANYLTNGIRTRTYTLTPGSMPVGEGQSNYSGTLPDNSVNFTADFGFVEAYSLGNRVWWDNGAGGGTAGDGLRNGTEPGIANVTVNLYIASNTTTPIATTTTDVNGYYRFDYLLANSYIVEVVPALGYSSTVDTGVNPNNDVDDDDNGVVFVGSNVRSNPVTLGPGGVEPVKENNPATNPESSLGEAPDNRSNRTVDFGFITANASSDKQLTATTMMDNGPTPGTDYTTTPEVAIGEILTYVARLRITSGANLPDLKAFDQLDDGLAFVGCDSISAPNLSTTGSFSGACSNPTVAPQTTPGAYTDASQITFALGDVSNSTADTQVITITYRVIVLDIPGNKAKVGRLNNKITWSWTGITLPPSQATSVEIVEPKLSIDKSTQQPYAYYGSPVGFTIVIAHTTDSSANAFDVKVTDVLPAGLEYIANSAIPASGSLAPTSTNYDSATRTLTFVWDIFPLGSSSTINFLAKFVGPAPVINTASVVWSSLAIDPQPISGLPVPLSSFNKYGTERWYDPLHSTGIDSYGNSDSATLNLLVDSDKKDKEPIRWQKLPTTGFAPDTITKLPLKPEGFAYAQTAIWLEVQKLGLKMDIVGVPFDNDKGEWNLTWLNTEAGWLENTAYPTHTGNSAITSHVTLANGLPGPFAKLGTLSYGDQIIVHLDGQKYIYEVRESKRVSPDAVNSALKHEEHPWLTLITCQSYNEKAKEYTYRTVVRAVLTKVVDE